MNRGKTAVIVKRTVTMIPAEPGWQALLTCGPNSYVVPVIAWRCETREWPAADDRDLGELESFGEPVIPAMKGAKLVTALDAFDEMAVPRLWRVERLLAPGQSVESSDNELNGWRRVQTPTLPP